MKNKIFYSFSIIIMVTSLLSSCSNVPAIITPTPSSTFTFTPAPTDKPTITPSPTETPDPNRPADAIGYDSLSGYYTKTQNGKTFFWIPIQFGSDKEKKIMGHWFEMRSVNQKPIPLYDHLAYYGDTDSIPLSIYFQESPELSSNIYFVHPDFQGAYETEIQRVFSLTGIIMDHMASRFYDKRSSKITRDEWQNFSSLFSQGKISIPFTTSEGTFNFRPSSSAGLKVFLVPWESTDPKKDSRFFDWSYRSDYNFNSMTTGDKDGNIIAIVASERPIDTLKDRDIIQMLFFNFARVILNEDQSRELYKNQQVIGQQINEYIEFAYPKITSTTPMKHIEVIRSP